MTTGVLPFELPDHLPMMVLPDCNLFPHCLLPLYIFEPRYREMLQAVLDSHRMFCIGTLRPEPEPEADAFARLYRSSTAGLVRACVNQADGCANLLLQGLHRVEICEIDDDLPYRVATVRALLTDPVSPEEESAKLRAVQTAARKVAEAGFPISDHVIAYLTNLDRLEILVDIITYHFVTDPHARQPFLEEPSLSARSDRLVERLTVQLHTMRDSGSGPQD